MRLTGVDDDTNALSRRVIGAALKVHTTLGSGLLERYYQVCLAHELRKMGLEVHTEVSAPIVYDDLLLEGAYRIDILVERKIIIEVKAVHVIDDVHRAQLHSYLRSTGCRVGLLLNFRLPHLKDGIERIVNLDPGA